MHRVMGIHGLLPAGLVLAAFVPAGSTGPSLKNVLPVTEKLCAGTMSVAPHAV